ncbi:MAG: glycosyl transferase [Planctomycetia bacterium]|nr:glycosyl transferase [Planctomycetia bacterium]
MQLIYFSPVRAASYAQRPHFMVEAWLARRGGDVLWIEPYPCRLPRAGDLARRATDDQGTAIDRRVEVIRLPALPIEPLPGGAWVNRALAARSAWRRIQRFAAAGPFVLGIGRPSAFALAALERLRPADSFYDAMDDFPEFHRGLSRRATRRSEDAVAARVGAVIASSTFLVEKFAARGLRVVHVPNGYPMRPLPPWTPRPAGPIVLGYVGCLGAWFDWPLVVRLALARPDAQIELVGPIAARVPRRLPENIRLFPPCSQAQAFAHLRRFSAGLIPFRLTALTAGVDPIKFYECRALGLPVLSTRFGDMAHRGRGEGVFFLDSDGDMAGVVDEALTHRTDAATVARFRAAHDWSRRFEDLPTFGKSQAA